MSGGIDFSIRAKKKKSKKFGDFIYEDLLDMYWDSNGNCRYIYDPDDVPDNVKLEVWKQHPDTNLGIRVSNLGRVELQSCRTFGSLMPGGHRSVHIATKTNESVQRQVHCLVLQTFEPLKDFLKKKKKKKSKKRKHE